MSVPQMKVRIDDLKERTDKIERLLYQILASTITGFVLLTITTIIAKLT